MSSDKTVSGTVYQITSWVVGDKVGVKVEATDGELEGGGEISSNFQPGYAYSIKL
jgi:hypothetical protein